MSLQSADRMVVWVPSVGSPAVVDMTQWGAQSLELLFFHTHILQKAGAVLVLSAIMHSIKCNLKRTVCIC